MKRRYFEPFLGAGSLFFSLGHSNAYLSDLNEHLIDCYRAIRDEPGSISRALKLHEAKDCEAYYYSVRDLYNRSRAGKARAARFIYLNRTGFNGVFRVNQAGAYNVPYGRKESPRFPTEQELSDVAFALEKARLLVCDYRKALMEASRGDFVYLDPPYPALNGTAYFTHYTPSRFASEDQQEVAECVRALDADGCLIMISNADTPRIRALYRGFHVRSLSVTRFVTSSSVKHRVRELIITNYESPADERAPRSS